MWAAQARVLRNSDLEIQVKVAHRVNGKVVKIRGFLEGQRRLCLTTVVDASGHRLAFLKIPFRKTACAKPTIHLRIEFVRRSVAVHFRASVSHPRRPSINRKKTNPSRERFSDGYSMDDCIIVISYLIRGDILYDKRQRTSIFYFNKM